jgi:hypothetical protein
VTPRPHTSDVAVVSAIPWERRRELGLMRAFRDTVVFSVREPRRFYGIVPEARSIWPALAYGLVFDLVVSLLGFAYTKAVGNAELEHSIAPMMPQLREIVPKAPEMITTLMSASAIGSLLVTPLSYFFNLFTTTFVTWIGLRLARGLHTSFGRLLTMFAYASWIQVFGLLALTGDIFLSAFSFLLVLGFGSYYWLVIVRESQRIDTGRAMMASLYGCLVSLAFGCLLGVPLAIGAAWLLWSMFQSTPILPPP